MKKLIFAVVTILALAACKKEKIEAHGKVDKVEPTSISFVTSSFSLEEGEERSLSIKAEPDWSKKPVVSVQDESKETAVEISSSDPSVVNVAGLKITALSPGTATVTASLKSNPSVYCTCSVQVREYIDAVTLTGIALSKGSLELSDLGSDGKGESEEITVNLLPINASWADVSIYSNDDRVSVEKGSMKDGEGKLTLRVASNTSHKPTSSNPATITVRAKKGGISGSASVKVCGHIYGISIPVLDEMQANGDWRLDSDKKTILYVRGNSLSIVPEIAKTGDLRTGSASGTFSIVSENPSNIAIASNGALSIPSSSVGGNSSTYYLKVSTTAAGISDIRIPVKTFEAPTGFTLKLNGNVVSGEGVVYAGNGSHILNISPQPDKALCLVKIGGSHADISNVTLTQINNATAKVEFNATSGSRYSNAIQVTSLVNGKSSSFSFTVDDFKAEDIKPGDFVYYLPSDPNGVYYYHSDGGLRAYDRNGSWARQVNVSPDSGNLSYLIGIIYDMTDQSSYTGGLKLRGFRRLGTTEWAYYNGKLAHASVISIKDPKAGDYTWEWCTSAFDLGAESGWDASVVAAPKGNTAYKTYLVYEQMRKWNVSASDSKRIKAIYSVDNYNDYNGMTENVGRTGALPLRKANTSDRYGSTGWMLPLISDMENLEELLSVVNTSISNARKLSNSCADLLTGPYWLANYSTKVYQDGLKQWMYAYAFVPNSGSNKIQELAKTNKYGTRPICFL